MSVLFQPMWRRTDKSRVERQHTNIEGSADIDSNRGDPNLLQEFYFELARAQLILETRRLCPRCHSRHKHKNTTISMPATRT